jgi:hypothetical protein
MSHCIVNDVAQKPNILTLNSWLSKHTLQLNTLCNSPPAIEANVTYAKLTSF